MFKKLLVVFFISAACVSCHPKPLDITKENVAGIWKAKAFDSRVPDMPPEFAEAGEKEFLSSVYTLKDDMSMELHSDYFQENADGHWDLDADTKEISMYYEYDTIKGVEKYIVKSLTTKEMVLRQDIEPVNGYVQLTLTR